MIDFRYHKALIRRLATASMVTKISKKIEVMLHRNVPGPDWLTKTNHAESGED